MPEVRVIHTLDTWDDTIRAMHSGERIEVSEGVYDYFLEVLPPIYMGRRMSLPGGKTLYADFGFAEGAEPITAFWHEAGNFYCQRTGEINRG